MAVPSSKSIQKLQDHPSFDYSPPSIVKKSTQEVFQIPIFADFSTTFQYEDDDIFKPHIMSSTTSSFNEEEVSIIIYHVNYIWRR